MASGAIMSLIMSNHNEQDVMHHTEAFEMKKTDMKNDETKDTYEGRFLRFGDNVPFVAFQLKSKIMPPPRGFPFTCIKFITIEASTSQYLILEISGKQLWCLYQTYPDAQRASIETAAKYGIVLIKDIIPQISMVSLPFVELRWKIQLDQNEYTRTLSSFKSSTAKWVADLVFDGIDDLGKLACLYGGLERGYLSKYTPFVFMNPEIRDKFSRNMEGTLHYRHHFQDWVGNASVPINCRFRNALQFNFIIERPDHPNTFYTPEDNPVKSIRLECNGIDMFRGSHDELYIIDKLIHNIPIPTHIAHYTYTFQTFENYKRQIGHVTDFNSIPISGKNTLNMNHPNVDFSVHVELSPHIDPNSRIHMWILGVGIMRYNGGMTNIFI